MIKIKQYDSLSNTLIFEEENSIENINNDAIIQYISEMENYLINSCYNKVLLDNVLFNGFKLGISVKDLNNCVMKKNIVKYQLIGGLFKPTGDIYSYYELLDFLEILSKKNGKIIMRKQSSKIMLDDILGFEFKKANQKELLEVIELLAKSKIIAADIDKKYIKLKEKTRHYK